MTSPSNLGCSPRVEGGLPGEDARRSTHVTPHRQKRLKSSAQAREPFSASTSLFVSANILGADVDGDHLVPVYFCLFHRFQADAAAQAQSVNVSKEL